MAEYVTASGPSLFECAFLGQGAGAHWVGVVRRAPPGARLPLDVGIRLGTRDALTDLWRDPDGGVWVVGEDGQVRHNPDPWGPDADQWSLQALDAALFGITGVHARCVLAHGIRQSDGRHVLRLYNGARWNPVGSPGFAIEAMHLWGPERIWVAGEGVGRWDGQGWDVLETPPILAIHAPEDDTVVVALEDGTLARVTPEGLVPFGRVEGACAVAIWNGHIWVGAGENGLWRAGRGELVRVREDRHCVALEVHDDGLLVACRDIISASTDGQGFPGGARDYLRGLSL